MLLRGVAAQAGGASGQFRHIGSDSIMGDLEIFDRQLFMVAVGLTAVFIVVGGIVIMNIHASQVTDRTREIGLAQILGARKRT